MIESCLAVRSLLLPAAFAILVGGCGTPPPSHSAPVPPPPDPPQQNAFAAVSGQVSSPRGSPIAHASVLIREADTDCRPTERFVGAVSDERGEYSARLESGDGMERRRCVIVEARSGGASGTGSTPVAFSLEGAVATVDVRLVRGQTIDRAEAERLVRLLAAAVNDPTADTTELGLYVLHGPEALRVALAQYRSLLGSVTAVTPVAGSLPDVMPLRFEMAGSNGRRSLVDVHQEELTRLHSPLLDYAFRAERFLNAYVRAISAADAPRLAQVLNPDDIDFPVERAAAIIDDYRRRYRDLSSIRAEFVDVDESKHTMTWRLRGEGADGSEIREIVQLGFGDGLIGMRGL